MMIPFSKYQAAGNDFILIDNRAGIFDNFLQQIPLLCDRRFGIGADGLILIQKHPSLNYTMVYFNSDGSQSLCGNGSRCGFRFAQSLGMIQKEGSFETTDGIHEIKEQDQLVHFQLKDVQLPQKITENEWFINTGSPHFIRLLNNIDEQDLINQGRDVRYSDAYKSINGTNFNLVSIGSGKISMRTYERGVENETLSCGTGATAVGLISYFYQCDNPVLIETKGGTLAVSYKKEEDKFKNIWLIGPAEQVFEGAISM
ncbi:MAG: diaminopimelate epimerase [Bacteroidota bacterium]